MTESEYKVCRNVDCSKEQPLHISEFNKRKENKDGLQSWCRDCMRKYKKKWLKDGDIYKHSIYKQAEGGFRRGQIDYNVPPYEGVLTEFESVQAFYEYLLSDDEYVKKNKELLDIYMETGNWFDKPSIGRIDHIKGYIKGNVRCESMGEQVKAVANKAYIGGYFMKFKNEIMNFNSINEAVKRFKISESEFKEKVNTGEKFIINGQIVEFATVENLEQQRRKHEEWLKEWQEQRRQETREIIDNAHKVLERYPRTNCRYNI